MPATIREIVDEALELIGEVAGVGTQQFSEDRMFHETIRGFNMLFKKRFWEQYCKWYTVVLDSTTGIITTDAFEQIRDFEDFQVVCIEQTNTPLPVLTGKINPRTLTGTKALCFTSLHVTHASYAKRKLQFYPVTATSTLDIRAREYPIIPPALQWDWEDTMYMDRDILMQSTAFMTLSGENADAAQIVRAMMDDKYSDIRAAIAQHPMRVSGSARVPTTWTEAR
jgi:hypothetical protein